MELKYGSWENFIDVVGGNDKSFMTPTELAKKLEVSRQTIYVWLKEDYLSIHKYKGPEGSYNLIEIEDMGELYSRVEDYKISRL